MTDYARVDVARLLPECLSDDFVIIIDDCQRIGEQHTVAYMKKIIEENDIKVVVGKYNGAKEAMLLCSEKYSFLRTM